MTLEMSSVARPDLAILPGFYSSKGIRPFQEAFDRKINPRTSTIIPSAPAYKALYHPDSIASYVDQEIDKIGSDKIVLAGHSYGALIAMVVGLRRKLKGILKLILIDGPLNNMRKIYPTRPEHYVFWRHYANRERLVAECEEILATLKAELRSRIVTISSRLDNIVPVRSKQLDGNFNYVYMQDSEPIEPSEFKADAGTNVFLPETYKGHSMNKRIGIVTDIASISLQPQLEQLAV